jgi:hypothetical protein
VIVTGSYEDRDREFHKIKIGIKKGRILWALGRIDNLCFRGRFDYLYYIFFKAMPHEVI